MLSYKSDFQGYACKFSPFVPDIVACGVSQYYGIIGNGKLIVLKKNQNSMAEIKKFDTNLFLYYETLLFKLSINIFNF